MWGLVRPAAQHQLRLRIVSSLLFFLALAAAAVEWGLVTLSQLSESCVYLIVFV